MDIPLERPGPSRRGICLMRASEARKASYFFASFLTSFLFLLSLYAGMRKGRAGRAREHALLQVINGHVLKVDLLGTVDVGGIGENADGHAGAGDVGEPGMRKTWSVGKRMRKDGEERT